MNRRNFLITAAALPAVSPLAGAGRVCRMRFGFTTYQLGQPWDIPTIIANCRKARAYGVELRTSQNYAHGVELNLTKAQRRQVRLQFIDSPVMLVGLACGERFDSPDSAALRASIEKAKAYVKLSSDVGATGLRVFPNNWHKDVPHEQTMAQIARSLTELGKFAQDYNQQIRLENHGSVGRLTTLATIMKQVDAPNVRIKLNCDAKDAQGGDFAAAFRQVRPYLGDTLHMHDLSDKEFPYQLQFDLLIDAGWDGWCLVERGGKVPDRLGALLETRRLWDRYIERSLKRV